MEEQATQLADAVSIFRLDNQVAAAVSAVTARIASPAPQRSVTPAAAPKAIARKPAPAARAARSTSADDGNWQEF
jgi:methyl-accepting chemotaxis protein